ncbi:Phthalate 4,5-dioxygenase oxygenase subunit [Thalassovita gelatinovora]|uniref:Phthalate 4,5-dioxygenase oxygenase subunit n=1 Tax=Thalassovita gelatinovora TaxID=53501 RepID=A0A0P1FRT5_THAGE|nr:Rieske 2Fe-2S domain-containing protein [Thalassovita gelatinovora]QIZ79170.1 Rieske 2Fe-2S domain-containing protein [Thalassovita gelatinovora]CUH63633.1 Phthalate 4,5-dioxygenase oxygenase subunit [Thalassovita gelatinovora]SER00757.1 Rieske [2Fe-2S] domain-containing protein [Thalassovita gelatinovora]
MSQTMRTEASPTTWVKIASAEALQGTRPVAAVTAFGQDLVLFRDEEGQLGLIGRYCPHRGADLCFGRHEDNGLRCPFHGWHFDRSGQCTEQPAEPEDSTMYKAIRLPSYTVIEQNGDILAWFGEGSAPAIENNDESNQSLPKGPNA